MQQQIITFLDEKPTCEIIPPKKAVYCNSNGNIITVNATGNGPFTYEWEIDGECDYHGNTHSKNLEFNIGFSSLTFTVTVTDKNGCTSECSYDLDCIFKGKIFKGLLDNKENPITKNSDDSNDLKAISVSPNPALNKIEINSIVSDFGEGYYTVAIYDVNFKMVKEYEKLQIDFSYPFVPT